MNTDLCIRAKTKLSELVGRIVKDILMQIDGVAFDGNIYKTSIDPLEDFLMLEIFLEKLEYFDLMVIFRDCEGIDIKRIISNSRNKIKSLAQKTPEELIEKIFSKSSSEKREGFKKYLDANLNLCKKIYDISR